MLSLTLELQGERGWEGAQEHSRGSARWAGRAGKPGQSRKTGKTVGGGGFLFNTKRPRVVVCCRHPTLTFELPSALTKGCEPRGSEA